MENGGRDVQVSLGADRDDFRNARSDPRREVVPRNRLHASLEHLVHAARVATANKIMYKNMFTKPLTTFLNIHFLFKCFYLS